MVDRICRPTVLWGGIFAFRMPVVEAMCRMAQKGTTDGSGRAFSIVVQKAEEV